MEKLTNDKMEKLTNEETASYYEIKGLKRFVSLDVSIKLFGVEVFSFHFPPNK